MVKEIRAYPLLLGVRGEEKKDVDSVVDTIIKVGTILQKCKRISDIEINPLVVYETRARASRRWMCGFCYTNVKKGA